MTVEDPQDDAPANPQDSYARIAAEADRFDRSMPRARQSLFARRRLLTRTGTVALLLVAVTSAALAAHTDHRGARRSRR